MAVHKLRFELWWLYPTAPQLVGHAFAHPNATQHSAMPVAARIVDRRLVEDPGKGCCEAREPRRGFLKKEDSNRVSSPKWLNARITLRGYANPNAHSRFAPSHRARARRVPHPRTLTLGKHTALSCVTTRVYGEDSRLRRARKASVRTQPQATCMIGGPICRRIRSRYCPP